MIELNLPDLSCGRCGSTVTRTCKMVDSAAQVQVDLQRKQFTIKTWADCKDFEERWPRRDTRRPPERLPRTSLRTCGEALPALLVSLQPAIQFCDVLLLLGHHLLSHAFGFGVIPFLQLDPRHFDGLQVVLTHHADKVLVDVARHRPPLHVLHAGHRALVQLLRSSVCLHRRPRGPGGSVLRPGRPFRTRLQPGSGEKDIFHLQFSKRMKTMLEVRPSAACRRSPYSVWRIPRRHAWPHPRREAIKVFVPLRRRPAGTQRGHCAPSAPRKRGEATRMWSSTRPTPAASSAATSSAFFSCWDIAAPQR